uniref:Uncharacterized protein n=1 Tax=Musa acuminata subsp. malaccensis TaxID=214687 RepID=A0A804JHS9_MUSAM
MRRGAVEVFRHSDGWNGSNSRCCQQRSAAKVADIPFSFYFLSARFCSSYSFSL